ncbi:MAG: ATP-binding protein [Verrucomicrobia bacterium]|nr:ATP-binding protein [Verrucomicrobiota bacterium]
MKESPAQTKVLALVLLAGVLPLLVSLAAHAIFGEAEHVQERLHECIELAGCCITLGVAILLLLRLRHEETSPHLLWVVAALVAMGTMDGMHSQIPFNEAFGWTRHASTFVGGMIFALVWLPVPAAAARRKRRFILAVGVLALAGSLAIYKWPERLPSSWLHGQFSSPVIAANVLGGLGFLAAALFFIRRYLREPRREDLVFASQTLIFSVSGLAFGFSHVWAADWWVWHGFRLLACSIVLVAAYETVTVLYEHIAQHALDLEDRVRERTAELVQSNQSLQTEIIERKRAEKAVEQSRCAALNMMEDAVAARDVSEQTSEALRREVEERRRAEDEVRRLNAELEQRVHDRTAQLEVANKELDAFSHSVSHDLRAPLRSMTGFATILTEDYAPRLDDEGRRLLGTICSEAGRMGRMINDLLAFSKLGRQSMQVAEIDMTALAQGLFAQCAAQAPGRNIQFKLQPLPPVHGDAALLSHVWSNLISNAIKYTRTKPVAEIEITGHAEDGQLLYCVKDNGAGFDMKYVQKLFGVFQRLHAEADFEGTGIGLSLVQRIVQRHGGRVWAEGEVNKGATFCFALPARGA